jgi:hypothetical protein
MTQGRAPTSRREAGQASVELALLLPLVVLLLLAVLQAGLVAKDVVLVTHAAREAARAAATDPHPDAPRRAAEASGGLRPDRLSLTTRGRGAAGTRVTVSVTYRIPTVVPLAGALVNDLVLTRSVTMRVEDG